MGKTIGVVIATYNGEKYVGKQLESIIEQTEKPDYIIVSDGGSSDKTVDVCKSLLAGSGIAYKVLTSEKQLSVPQNFNKALQNCECDYIFFADQDDYWIKNKIKTIIHYMKSENACMAFSNAMITDGELNPVGVSLWKSVGFDPAEKITVFPKQDKLFVDELIKHNVVTGMTMCITSELRNFVLPLFSKGIHDKWISLLAAYFGRIVAVNQKLVLYRQHGNNVVGTKKSLNRSLRNKKDYIHKIEERREMINKVAEKISSEEKKNPFDFDKYIDYLSLRERYVKRKNGGFYALKLFKNYCMYEYKPLEILIKDIIIRI